MEKGESIPVFGDGSAGRDYTHVDDIVAGIRAALNYEPLSTEARYDVFNLGNSHPVKLSELLEIVEKTTGRKASRDLKPNQPGDVPLTWADISKAERLLGYHPQVGLEEGLKAFVAWYRKVGAHRGA
jgi:UDP-glucuronate 4-epimerase